MRPLKRGSYRFTISMVHQLTPINDEIFKGGICLMKNRFNRLCNTLFRIATYRYDTHQGFFGLPWERKRADRFLPNVDLPVTLYSISLTIHL